MDWGCFSFTTKDLQVTDICKVVLSIVSIMGCLFVILVIITYKKYIFTFQRLVLYLTLSFLLDAIVRIVQGASYTAIHNPKYCQALAFFYEYTSLCILLSMLCMVLEIFLSLLRNKNTNQLKLIYAAVIFGIPLCVSWIPFPFKRYGLTGTDCNIIYYNENCTTDTAGLVTLAILWWLPLSISFIVTGPVYLLIVYRIQKHVHEYTAIVQVQRHAVHDQETKHIGYFKWFPFIYFFINLLPIVKVLCIVLPNKHLDALWITTSALLGLQGGVVALVATLDPNTRRVLRWNSFKAAWRQNVMGKSDTETYHLLKAEGTDSINT